MSLVEELETLGHQSSDAMAGLEFYRVALLLGRLHVCGNCRHYVSSSDVVSNGHCARFNAEATPFIPFTCTDFDASSRPLAPAYTFDSDGSRAWDRS